jgi:hypothetical protein
MVATKFLSGIHLSSKSPLTTPKIKERRVHEMHESTWKRSPQKKAGCDGSFKRGDVLAENQAGFNQQTWGIETKIMGIG